MHLITFVSYNLEKFNAHEAYKVPLIAVNHLAAAQLPPYVCSIKMAGLFVSREDDPQVVYIINRCCC